MKCRYCGYEIPEGMLYCDQCGNELCIVPEYNPLDDMLTAQIKVAINDEDSESGGYIGHTSDMAHASRTGRTTGRNIRGNTGRNTANRKTGRNTGGVRNTSGRMLSEKEQRKRQNERKRALKKKKRAKLLGIMAVIILIIVIAGVVLYQNSYTGIVNKGYKAEQKKDYDNAVAYFEKAIGKNAKKADAYKGLSKVYIAQNDETKAEDLYLNAIKDQPQNTDLYEACIGFYGDTDQMLAIPFLLEEAASNVKNKLAGYIVDPPIFSLDDQETFDDVQQLALTTEEKSIYYTTDGKNPTFSSTKYTEPIQLQEGSNEIIGMAVNKDGIPSLPAKKTYRVELPIEDAPAVSPSTGQYESAETIEIKVPEGYMAYYTMDKSDPTTASTKYSGPIDMPPGETIFKAILVNSKGKTSGITTRNYLLEN